MKTTTSPIFTHSSVRKTPFEILREEQFNVELEKQLNWVKDLDKVEQFTFLDQAVVKPNSLVNVAVPYKRRKKYNSLSLQNLQQFEKERDKEAYEEIQKIKKQKEIENVNDWSASFLQEYEAKKGKKYKGLLSKQVSDKLFRTASVFVRSILSGFVSTRGFCQRSVSFCTFTLTENQKHSDDVIIKTFVDFIDHLKKVNNYIIDPVTKERTKEKALVIENYLWRAETQENGSIHFHLIADTFLNQDMLRRVWNNYLQALGYKYGYGAANVNSLKRDKSNNKILNVERYLCKYMTKPPLRNAFKGLKPSELEGISDEEKYRRPVIGKSWGCSRKLLKLEYPKFYGSRAKEVVDKLKDKLKEIKNERIPDFIRVWAGNTRKVFRTLSYTLQRELKNHYLLCLHWLYDEIPLDDYGGLKLSFAVNS